MARCPFATWRPLRENAVQDGIIPRAVILHTAVSDAQSLFGFFQNSSDLESHFYVNESGHIEQYIDTGVRADANLNANDFAVSIETWDGRETIPWNELQVKAIVRLVDWLCSVHPISREKIASPTGKGIGWHTMFGAPGPWTNVRGKTCPGAPRIAQTKNIIIPSVQKLGNTAQEVADMTSEESRKLNELWELWHKGNQTAGHPQTTGEGTGYVVEMLGNSRDNANNADRLTALEAKVDAILAKLG